MEGFSVDLLGGLKIENVLWKWGVGVCLDCQCMEFVTTPGFIQGWRTDCESQIPSFCF